MTPRPLVPHPRCPHFTPLQSQPLTPENILLREATYRAVGEVFPHVQSKVDFGSWYASELRLMLQSGELTGEGAGKRGSGA